MYKFKADHVGLVAETDGAVITRGATPLNQDAAGDYTFAYDELIARVRELSIQKLEKPTLIDICLLDCVDERDIFVPEIEAFGVHGYRWPSTYWPPYLQAGWMPTTLHGVEVCDHIGCLCWWPIQGMAEGDDYPVFLESPGWDLDGCVENITTIVKRKYPESVIYFHCSSGADRTGALHTCYLLKQGMGFQKACEAADSLVGPPNVDYCRLRTAYDVYLKSKNK